MNKTTIEELRQLLLQRKEDLQELQKAAEEAGRPVELDQARVGRLSRMDAMQAQQMACETARRRQTQLAMIEGALRRIDSGDYGYCSVCGKEIDVRRLAVNPTTTRCIACAD